MIKIQTSSNQTEADCCKVYWHIQMPECIAEEQYRPTSMKGTFELKHIKVVGEQEIIEAYAELKVLNALLCNSDGLSLLDLNKLNMNNVEFLSNSPLTINALHGGIKSKNKLLFTIASPIAIKFFGCGFKITEELHFDSENCNYISANDYQVNASSILKTSIGNLLLSRKCLDSFTRKKNCTNAYADLVKVIDSAQLTFKDQTQKEREIRISKTGFDSEIISLDNQTNEPGLHLLIQSDTQLTDNVECFKVITLFYQNQNSNPKEISQMESQSLSDRYDPTVLYVEKNTEKMQVTAQWGNQTETIQLSNQDSSELHYIDAAFMAINIIQLNTQPANRLRIFTNFFELVNAFVDVANVEKLVNSTDKVQVKLLERISIMIYKTRLFSHLKGTQKKLRPLAPSLNPLKYRSISFDDFCRVRNSNNQMMILKPHAFRAFLIRSIPEQVHREGRNPLAFLQKVIKSANWKVVKHRDQHGNSHWYDDESNSLIVVADDDENNTLNIVTFWRGNKYEDYQAKIESGNYREITHETEIPLIPLKIIK